jgi:hypothetical protein
VGEMGRSASFVTAHWDDQLEGIWF